MGARFSVYIVGSVIFSSTSYLNIHEKGRRLNSLCVEERELPSRNNTRNSLIKCIFMCTVIITVM
jgi:hypothetical protein